jgi:hypothetical protein
LELNSDNTSLFAGVLDYAITSKYIYVLPTKEFRLLQFDREGHYMKDVVRYGDGPGEFNGFAQNIYADEMGNRLYIVNMDKTWEYTLDGKFVAIRQHKNMMSREYKIGEDRWAAISYLDVPFQIPGIFGIAVFSAQEDTIAMKKDFYIDEVSKDRTGFTDVASAQSSNSVLFKTTSNDTVFRLSPIGISPAYILKLDNSENEKIRGAEVRNRRDILPDDIKILDMIETDAYFYYRFFLNE